MCVGLALPKRPRQIHMCGFLAAILRASKRIKIGLMCSSLVFQNPHIQFTMLALSFFLLWMTTLLETYMQSGHVLCALF